MSENLSRASSGTWEPTELSLRERPWAPLRETKVSVTGPGHVAVLFGVLRAESDRLSQSRFFLDALLFFEAMGV